MTGTSSTDGNGETGGDPKAAEHADDRAKTDADSGGGASKDEAKTEERESFKPITSEAELAAYTNGLRKNITADVRRQVRDEVKREQDAANAKAKGDFEALAKSLQAQLDVLQGEIDSRDRAELRRTIAAKHGLSPDLADRLLGETEDELNADAKQLAKHVKPPAAPDTEGGDRRRENSGVSTAPLERETRKPTDPLPAFSFTPRGAVPIPD